jgi:predicted nucleic acid-binding protein
VSVVVDASVVITALVDSGPNGAWAEKIIESGPLYGPEMVRVESTHILRRLERAKELMTQEANAAFEDLAQLEIELFPFEPFADRVWELRHTVTSYDAWYVAVAESLKLPLATLDERLVKSEGPRCKFLTPNSR